MRRGSTAAPPAPGKTPKLACASPMRVLSAAMIRSQAIASSSPPAMVRPLSAAMVGLGSARRRSIMPAMRSRNALIGSSAAGTAPAFSNTPLRSAPAQKARPAPVSTSTRISGSRSICAMAASNSLHIVSDRAFIASGRFSVIHAVARRRSNRRAVVACIAFSILSVPRSAACSVAVVQGRQPLSNSSAMINLRTSDVPAPISRILMQRNSRLISDSQM